MAGTSAPLVQAVNAVSGVRLARKQETCLSSRVLTLLIRGENETSHTFFLFVKAI